MGNQVYPAVMPPLNGQRSTCMSVDYASNGEKIKATQVACSTNFSILFYIYISTYKNTYIWLMNRLAGCHNYFHDVRHTLD